MWLRAPGACEALAGKRGQAEVLPTQLCHLHQDTDECSKGAVHCTCPGAWLLNWV